MLVKAIMIPFNQLQCLTIDNSVDESLNIIEENRLLSLPVVDGKKFVGVVSKQYLFEQYFKSCDNKSKEEFLKEKIDNYSKASILTIGPNVAIEDAAALFITSKYRFIPIVNDNDEFMGIITHQAIFKEYQKIFGDRENVITIYTSNFKGAMAKIADTIAKAGGNIRNIVQIDTNVMNVQEIYISVACNDFEKVVNALKRDGFNVKTTEVKKD